MADEQEQPRGPSVEVRPNGPVLVRGGLPIRRRRVVESEHGEPLTWETTEQLPAKGTAVLCRCGASATKPFCDSTHARVGFDGTEAAATDGYDERARTYEVTGVVVRDDRSICHHAGFCGNRVTNVWKLVKGGTTEDSLVRLQVMEMVERCPSGALTYRLSGDGDDVEPDLATAVTVVADGPLLVNGGVPVTRADGEAFETRNRVALCRCGASAKKPLCDGSHKEVGFKDG